MLAHCLVRDKHEPQCGGSVPFSVAPAQVSLGCCTLPLSCLLCTLAHSHISFPASSVQLPTHQFPCAPPSSACCTIKGRLPCPASSSVWVVLRGVGGGKCSLEVSKELCWGGRKRSRLHPGNRWTLPFCSPVSLQFWFWIMNMHLICSVSDNNYSSYCPHGKGQQFPVYERETKTVSPDENGWIDISSAALTIPPWATPLGV